MIAKEELQEAIDECKLRISSYQTCEKLAILYTVMDHLYPEEQQTKNATSPFLDNKDNKVFIESRSEFMQSIQGKHPNEAFVIIDELMDTLQLIQPRLYTAVMRKIKME